VCALFGLDAGHTRNIWMKSLIQEPKQEPVGFYSRIKSFPEQSTTKCLSGNISHVHLFHRNGNLSKMENCQSKYDRTSYGVYFLPVPFNY